MHNYVDVVVCHDYFLYKQNMADEWINLIICFGKRDQMIQAKQVPNFIIQLLLCN